MTKPIESLSPADAAAVRAGLGLGTAATQPSTAFATAAQGSKADSALQSPTASGLTITVPAFRVGEFAFPGGSITLPASGTWFVGVDLFSGELRTLPRLGHRGWVPVAACLAPASTATVLPIAPVLPDCRLPRTVKKVLAGQGINVLVMGSSLAEGGGTTDWSGMLFSSSSSVAKYKVPGTITFNNIALGGTPNQYQLAQVGLGSQYAALDYADSGFPMTIAGKTPPNGRSSIFTGVDLVVITTLANGGDYRLECIEPIIRQLRKMGIEVVLTTDNPQGAAQVGGTGPYIWAGGYSAVTSAALYTDGPELLRIADAYKCELADTAAYVAEAVLRYPTANIYRDSIHMYNSAPAGRTGQPGGGYEVYARAIRSVINVDAAAAGTVVLSYDFNDGTAQGWGSYTSATVANSGSALVTTKNTAATQQWGAASPSFPALAVGDVVTVTGTISGITGQGLGINVGIQVGGWGSNVVGLSADGAFSATFTMTSASASPYLLIYGGNNSAANGASFTVDNISITVNSSIIGAAFEVCRRGYSAQIVPQSRILSDYKTPGDAFVILPKDEYHYVSSSNAGTLGAHPLGAGSFARRFSSAVGASQDLLTLVTGNRAAIAALGVVGFALIYYSVNGDPAVTFDVYKNNNFQKTVTIGAQTISRECYLEVYTPTQLGKADAVPNNDVIDIRVTSGTLRVAALIALTFDLDLLPPEAVSRIGTWTAKVPGGYPNMPGYATDTAGDSAVMQCPPSARRLAWICSSKPNSKPVDTWSGRTITSAQATAGTNHVRVFGNHVGPGEAHYIKLTAAQANTDQSTNGYGLHIGGVVLVNDR
jgi:hypothetical protein